MKKESTTSVNSPSAPTWKNWSGNLVHSPPSDGTDYYFTPANQADLITAIETAKSAGAILRVSGQRHSQPPLVINDNRDATPVKAAEYLVDMSCYADLGTNKDKRIELHAENQVKVNVGVREDELDAFLSANNLMFKTVTAGGFFSLGGMTAVDVHGATIDSSIFASDVSEFNIMQADKNIVTIDENSPIFKFGEGGESWKPLQFARVSLGGLGIVTSIVLNVIKREYATTLDGGTERLSLFNRADFAAKFKTLLKDHTRVESFFTPYAAKWGLDNFLILWWDILSDPKEKLPNKPTDPLTACQLADKHPPEFGAPYIDGIGQFGAALAEKSQYTYLTDNPLGGPAVITALARDTIEKNGKAANLAHSELWLDEAVAVIFMSYFIPLPNLDEEGLGLVWDSIDLVTKKVTPNGNFHIAAPMEFRFVKGGDASMSGAYSDKSDVWFVNQDLIAFVKPDLQASQYPAELLQFFADVEREWVAMDGFPHNGKMYGFYDPTADEGTYAKDGPFNVNFLNKLRNRRGTRLEAYNAFRAKQDPNGLFYNKYLKNLMEG